MSHKNLDKKNRLRSKIVSFRVSPEENDQLNIFVSLSGLNKQDYIIRKLTEKEVVIHGNPKVYKALRNQFQAVLEELKRIKKGGDVSEELLETIQMISTIMNGMKEET